MPRKKMSLQELQLRGSLKKNKAKFLDRLIPQAPAPAVQVSTLEPPRNLRAAEKSAFREIADARPWLSAIHRIQVELAASLICRMRNVKTPASRADLALLERTLRQLDKNTSRAAQPVATQPAFSTMTQRDAWGKAGFLHLMCPDGKHTELLEKLGATGIFLTHHNDIPTHEKATQEVVSLIEELDAALKAEDGFGVIPK